MKQQDQMLNINHPVISESITNISNEITKMNWYKYKMISVQQSVDKDSYDEVMNTIELKLTKLHNRLFEIIKSDVI